MLVAGIDPGTNRIGYALVKSGPPADFISAEVISIPSHLEAPDRLSLLHHELARRLTRDNPEAVAVEKLFFAKNTKTALAVAEARGIILLTVQNLVRNIWEYTPLEIKMALTGYGRADKDQMRRMVRMTFPKRVLPKSDDAVDALAIALAAMYLRRN
ncbi:MAG: crossover junction endodeoxyribonuclease RuvC [Candidatus Sungbacteria bacterium]|nr:crossover junction endodeoxyribonuclease RuvC [Candidatus Sungbacteria bacterium]